MRRGKKLPITLLVILIDVVLFGAVMLFHSRSNTSIGGAVVFAAVWAFWTVVRSLIRRNRIDENALSRFVFPSFILGAGLLTWATVRLQSVVLSFFGETIDFNGRSAIWHYSWTGFLERPLIGWGWMSAWRTPPFMHRDLWWSFVNTGWSHSGYMDLLLGGGIFASMLFIGAVVWGGFRQLSFTTKATASQWTPAIMFFVLATATQESFFVGNHFLWLLFAAAVAGDLQRVNSPQDQS